MLVFRPPEHEVAPAVGLFEKGQPGPVLVTLDETSRSEAIVAPAFQLAGQLGADLHLLQVFHVIEPVVVPEFGMEYLYTDYDPEEDRRALRAGAQEHLEEVCQRVKETAFEKKPLEVSCTVLEGEPAKSIIEYASRINASMIAMATHARGNIGAVIIGSVAEEVLHKGNRPVLLVSQNIARDKEQTGEKTESLAR